MTAPLTQEKFQQKVDIKTNGEIRCKELYKGSHAKHWFEHIPCGHTFQAKPNNLFNHKYTCPLCRENLVFNMNHGHVSKVVDVRCEYKHRFQIPQDKIPAFYNGEIECPICKRLKVLDPLYKDAIVDFSFERNLGFFGRTCYY